MTEKDSLYVSNALPAISAQAAPRNPKFAPLLCFALSKAQQEFFAQTELTTQKTLLNLLPSADNALFLNTAKTEKSSALVTLDISAQAVLIFPITLLTNAQSAITVSLDH